MENYIIVLSSEEKISNILLITYRIQYRICRICQADKLLSVFFIIKYTEMGQYWLNTRWANILFYLFMFLLDQSYCQYLSGVQYTETDQCWPDTLSGRHNIMHPLIVP